MDNMFVFLIGVTLVALMVLGAAAMVVLVVHVFYDMWKEVS